MKRSRVQVAISGAVITIVFFFLIKTLLKNWEQIQNQTIQLNPGLLILSVLFFIIGTSSLALAWRRILIKTEPQNTLKKWEAIRIYVFSELSRYVPGKIWPIIGKVHLCQQHGFSKKGILISTLLNQVLSLTATTLIGILLLLFSWKNISQLNIYTLLIPIAIGLILIHPRLFYPTLNYILQKTKQIPIPPENTLTYNRIVMHLLEYILASALRFSAFALFAYALIPIPIKNLPFLVGAGALATAVGVMAIFTPSGLGVKEGVLTLLIQQILPSPIAVLLAVSSRIWNLLAELFFATLLWINKTLSPKQTCKDTMMQQNKQYFTDRVNEYCVEYFRDDEAYLVDRYFLNKNGKLLVLGCGAGRTLPHLADRGFKDIHAIDIVPEMVQAAKKKTEGTNINIRTMDATQLDYSNESFDYIFFPFHGFDCIHPDPYACIQEVVRVLKPNGTLIFNSHNRLFLKKLPLFFKGAFANYEGALLYRATPWEMRRLKKYFSSVTKKYRISMQQPKNSNWKDRCYQILPFLSQSIYFICQNPKKR